MYYRTPFQAAVAASILIGSTANAQEAISVDPVIVTATRSAQVADEAVAPVDVITREEIERSGAVTVSEVLRGHPGTDVSQNGAFGKSASVNIRGLGSSKVLYLVNGRRLGNPSSANGAPSIQHIPTSQIERIEVVRGPRSTLYGSEALGGVVNIITRQPGDGAFSASVGAGSYSSKSAGASVSGKGDKLSYSLSANAFETDGYDVRDDEFDDRDGYENLSLSGRSSYAATDRLRFTLDFLVDEGTTEFDNCSDASVIGGPSFGDCDTEFEQHTVGIGSEYQVSANWQTGIQLARSREERRNFFESTFNNEFDGATTTASWQNDVQIGDAQIATLGVEDTTDKVAHPDDFAEDERGRTAAFGQWQIGAGAHDLVVGVRGIDDEQFGNHTTGSVDYGVEVAEGLRFLASVGTAFKAPTLYQLYSPQYGNEELEPEKSASVEFGLEGAAAWGDWSLRAYRTEVRDLIEFVDFTVGYDNVGEVEVNGLEVGTEARIGEWDADVSYSWNESINEETGSVLPNRAERTFRLSMDRALGAWNAGGSVVAQSARSGGAFSDPVPGYGILNLHAGYRVTRDWRIRGSLENAFDKDYQTNDGYFAAGRTAFIHLDYRPGSGI